MKDSVRITVSVRSPGKSGLNDVKIHDLVHNKELARRLRSREERDPG